MLFPAELFYQFAVCFLEDSLLRRPRLFHSQCRNINEKPYSLDSTFLATEYLDTLTLNFQANFSMLPQ